MTIFCEYAFMFATYENVLMFLKFTSIQLYMFGGYVCLSIVLIVYFISYRSIYVTQSKPFLSFFLSFSNILE